tara:strand:- start:660 stop:1640 length:981 start_codon:yes stop_codon:yes gene_type:complete
MKLAWLSNYSGILLLLMLTACSVSSQTNTDWRSLYYRDHPFAGKVFSTHNKTWISPQQLDESIKHEHLILLGETHSNPDHHLGQAKIIEKWLSNKQPTALVLEMLAYDEWVELQSEYMERHTLAALHHKLEEVSGQWDWEIYKPVLEVQVNHQLPIVGANLTRDQLDEYASAEKCLLARGKVSLEVCDSLSMHQQTTIKQLIFDAHCGYLPLERTDPLVRIQVAKDASFALSMANIGNTHKVALIAGAVHVRKDIGVPVHLQRLGRKSVSIAFVNVDPDKLSVEEYLDHAELIRQFDYLYFTPSERNQDPCIEFAEQLNKMKKLTR